MTRTITARVHRAARQTGEQLLLALWTVLVFLFGNAEQAEAALPGGNPGAVH